MAGSYVILIGAIISLACCAFVLWDQPRGPPRTVMTLFALVDVLVIVSWLLTPSARAEWKPEYAQASPAVRDWYRGAQLTPDAQKRLPFKNCCDHADVVRTSFKVNSSNGQDEWFWLDGVTWKRIPPDVIHWGETAPDKRPTLFVYKGIETCFWPGEGGI